MMKISYLCVWVDLDIHMGRHVDRFVGVYRRK